MKSRPLAFWLFFGVFAVYAFQVLNYTLFQFQFLIVMKWFNPGLILQGLADENRWNLIPLVTLTAADTKTSLLNLLLLMPFGFGIPLLVRVSLGQLVGLAALVSAAIEALQLGSGLMAGITFRVADVNDLLFNTLGAAVGYVLFHAGLRILRRLLPLKPNVTNPVLRYVLTRGGEDESSPIIRSPHG